MQNYHQADFKPGTRGAGPRTNAKPGARFARRSTGSTIDGEAPRIDGAPRARLRLRRPLTSLEENLLSSTAWPRLSLNCP